MSLTQRETQVLQSIAGGLSNRAIAHRLKISESTVKIHIRAIFVKLRAESRTDAVIRGLRHGVITL